MVYRVYVEKKPGLRNEADALLGDLRDFQGLGGLTGLRLLNRYDVENIDRGLFDEAVATVFSEPQLDDTYFSLPEGDFRVLAVEYLPGQFDQRADSAAQCIQIISQGERPVVRTARVYLLSGALSDADIAAARSYLINPVESREASLAECDTLLIAAPTPENVAILSGLRELSDDEAGDFTNRYGLAMDAGDLCFLRDYFKTEGRDPTLTELRVVDTYWSDHCRHTTFNTIIENVSFEDDTLNAAWRDYLAVRESLSRTKPITLMDLGIIAAKRLKADGKLDALDESDEINACTVRIKAQVDGESQDWLLLFKNETHNHPTEIEPFGGAATCIGGAIRDPLSGRAWVYSAMRVTGAADPRKPVEETVPGKLPQKRIVNSAAAGYSSYGNQIGLATGQVSELYHPGYAAKRMEIGAVVGAVPAGNVRRETPQPGDVVLLLGGRTGRDGIGGATGSSKSHDMKSLTAMASEVQKGNAPEERKLQRLFRNREADLLIKRCNDFGAGGVSVAIGELTDGLSIDLDAVPKKYEGLDGTELAISESQERMAVVVARESAERFSQLAYAENLECTQVATVTEAPRLTMRWRGKTVVDISRAFLDSNGAKKYISITPEAPKPFRRENVEEEFPEAMRRLAGDLNVCSQRGLSERFDSTVGAGTVLMPFGGSRQLTPAQATANLVSLEHGHTEDCSFMAWGYNPYIAEKSPYHGAYLSVVESVSKLVAAGAGGGDMWLSFQEYFEKLLRDGKRWGKPLSALLGALRAQLDLGVAAIGGKDSMSGSFEKLDVPPTLVSFAVTMGKAGRAISPEFKKPRSRVFWLRPKYDAFGLPEKESLKKVFDKVNSLAQSGKILAAWTPGYGGAAEGLLKMCMGNGLGFESVGGVSMEQLFDYSYGSFLLELPEGVRTGELLGSVTRQRSLSFCGETVELDELEHIYENGLESVFRCNIEQGDGFVPVCETYVTEKTAPSVKVLRPSVLIPVFPGTNCEYDSARAMEDAGAQTELFVINNLSAASIADSVERFAKRLRDSQIVFIPGGFSGGDEPEGSAKFITAFFRSEPVKDAVHELLKDRDGLMLGVCNGFQALVKLGLVPYGEIRDAEADSPTLTFNTIGRHQSRIVRTRVASDLSPWLAETKPGEVYMAPVSHGEGRFLCPEALLKRLESAGQIVTQYADENGDPTMDVRCNPNGSVWAVEGICSPDGRVLGKMGHSERTGSGLYKNVPGDFDMGLFRSAVRYFR